MQTIGITTSKTEAATPGATENTPSLTDIVKEATGGQGRILGGGFSKEVYIPKNNFSALNDALEAALEAAGWSRTRIPDPYTGYDVPAYQNPDPDQYETVRTVVDSEISAL